MKNESPTAARSIVGDTTASSYCNMIQLKFCPFFAGTSSCTSRTSNEQQFTRDTYESAHKIGVVGRSSMIIIEQEVKSNECISLIQEQVEE